MMQVPTRRGLGEGREGEDMSEQLPPTCRGSGDGMQAKGTKATRETPTVIAVGSTGGSRGTGRAVWGGGEARSTDEAG